MQTLVRYGWSPKLQFQLDSTTQSVQPARVINDNGETMEVITENGPRMVRVPHALDRPCVGDWVGLEHNEHQIRVSHLFERQTLLLRKAPGTSTRRQPIGANIHTAFITTSANKDFSLRRIERMLAALASASIRPVVLLTKADLTTSIKVFERETRQVSGDGVVLSISAQTGEGLNALYDQLRPGETHVLIGSSGVGKSTLVNRLLGTEQQAVLPIRADGTGCHATTRRELFALPRWGALLMDTPGMREFALGDDTNMGAAFTDVEGLMSDCRFRNCTHTVEPGCGVLDALDSGVLDPGRWVSYAKLKRELKHLQKRDSARELKEKRAARRRR